MSDLLEHIAKAMERARKPGLEEHERRDFYADAARALLSEAAKELAQLRAELAVARDGLRWYVDRYGVDGPQSDISAKAREVLAAITSRETETK